jgi:hypothetical protein
VRPATIRPPRRKLRRNLIVVALVSVGGLVFAIVAHPLHDRILGAVLFLGAGALAIAGRRTLRGREPLLLVERDGLRHRTLGLVPWDDVEALRITHGRLRACLHVDGRVPFGITESALPFSAELFRDLVEERAGRTWPH